MLSVLLLSGADLEIIGSGKTNYAIVYADSAPVPGIAVYNSIAADTLHKLFRHATGVRLPIYKESAFPNDRKAIFIGNTAAARKAGLTPPKWEIWEHRIDVKEGNIYLHGMDHRNTAAPKSRFRTYFVLGSYKACMTFLEKFAGAVFAGTPKLQDAVPQQKRITVPENYKFRHVPKIQYTTTGGGRRSLEYDVANNAFFSPHYGNYGGHNHPVAVPMAKYFKSNPEYFSLRKGKRDPGRQNQLCLANKKVQELIYQELLDHLDEGYEMVQLAQSDGFVPCECQPCRELFGVKVTASPKNFSAHRQDPAWGEKLWILHRGFAQRLLKDRPGKKVCIIAYGPTRRPPVSFKEFPSNVTIELAPFSEEIIEQWKNHKVPGGFTVYLYNWGFYKAEGFMPKQSWDFCKKQVQLFHRNNVRGIYCCGFGELHGLEGPTYYIWLKLLQDPELDINMLLQRFCRQTFGKAASQMEEFYKLMDKRLQLHFSNKEIDWNDPALLNGTMPASRINIGTINLRWPDEIVDRLESILAKAEKAAPGNWQLKLTRLEFDFMKYTAKAVNQLTRFRRTLSATDYKAFEKLALKRLEVIENLPRDKKKNYIFLDGMPLFSYAKADQILAGGRLSAPLYAPFCWDLKFLKEKNVIPAGRTIKPDGKAHCFVPLNYLNTMTDPYKTNSTSVLCKRDDKNLYVYFIMANADYQKMRNVGISVFLGPDLKNLKRFAGRFRNGHTSQYVFVKSNAANKGQGMEMKIQGSGVRITVPAPNVKLAKGEIAALITIPWSKFGKVPAPGEKWLFNALSDFTTPKHGRIYAIWEHNFDQATWRNTIDRQGTIEF